MNTVKSITKNTAILFVSQSLTFVLSFFYTIYMARYLGAANFGILSFAISFTGIFSVLADLGLSTLTTREVARNKSLSGKYLVNIASIKLFLVTITFMAISIVINLLGYPQQTINIVYIIALSVILGNFSLIFYSLYQAFEKMEYQSLAQTITGIIMFLGIIYAIQNNYNIFIFAMIYLLTSATIMILNIIIYILKFESPKLDIDLNFWKILLYQAIPFSLLTIFSTVSFRIDAVFLSLLVNNTAVGLYSAAYKLLEALLVVPYTFSIAVLPIFSRFFISSENALELSYRKTVKFLMILGIPIAFGTTILANRIILVFLGNGYADSVFILQILIWAIPFLFLTYILKIFLVSVNKQYAILKLTIITMLINIISNLILIPKYSYIGASIATVITEFTLFVFCFYYISMMKYKISLKNFINPLMASIIMAISIIILQKLDLILLIVIGSAIYFVCLFIMKTFTKEDLNLVKKILD